jgi:hypothetical protein
VSVPDDTQAPDQGSYPQASVTPVLPNEDTACNSRLPGGEVVEWFDFGQFVELLAVDSAGVSHPVVLANKEEIARAAGQSGQDGDVPLRVVDVVGGIPLSDIADMDRGSGAGALQPISVVREVVVADVDAVITDGQVTAAGVTYRVTLAREEAQLLASGQQLTCRARLISAGKSPEVTIRLIPLVYDVPVPDLDALLAARAVTVKDGQQLLSLDLALEPAEVTALLAGNTIVARATDAGGGAAGSAAAGRTRLVRLVQTASTPAGPARPERPDNTISDLAAFLAKPEVPGDDGRPFALTLTHDEVHDLRTAGTTSITLADNTVLKLTVATAVTVATAAMQRRRPRDDGDLGGTDGDLGGTDTTGDEPEEPVTPKAKTVETVATISAGSAVAHTRYKQILTDPRGFEKIKKFFAGAEPLPITPPPPARPPFHLRVALFLPWRQTWTMKGLSRGRLMQSLALAPEEEATIELQTWERHRKTLEQSTETDTEQSIEGIDTTKDTSEIYGEVQRQSDFQYQVGGSMRATYRPAAGEIEIGANAELSGKTAINQIGKNTQTRLHEAVIKASTKVRTQRTTKITETVEWGSEQRVTRRIRNPNLCHTLNLDYYEVLAHYDIVTAFLPADTKLCAMVENPVSVRTFTDEIVRVNETALRDALLDRALAEGFDAIRLLGAYTEAKLELADRKAAAALAAKIGAPEQKKDTADDPQPSKQQADLLDALASLVAAAGEFAKRRSPGPILTAIGDHATIDAELKRSARRWVYTTLVEAKFPNFAAILRDLPTNADAKETADVKVRLRVAQQLAGAIPAPTGNPTLGALNDLTDADKEAAGLAGEIHQHMAAAWDWAWWSGRCKEEQLYTPDDMGVPAAAQRLADRQTALDSAPTVDKAAAAGKEMAAAADQKQSQQAAEDVLEMKFGLEDVGRARERRSTLLNHLNDHLDYYRFVLFQALPPSEQLDRLMDGSGGALRVGMFEPRVVSMHGPYLAVPLHNAGEDIISKFRETIIDTLSTIPTAISRVMLPTPGMTIESRLGRCSAAEEFIEQSRAIELRRLTANARQAELEADRLEARLAAKKLDDPKTPSVPVSLQVGGPNGAEPGP